MNWVSIDTEAEGRKAIAPILALKPTVESIYMVTYNKLIEMSLFGLGPADCLPIRINSYGANYCDLPSSIFQKLFQTMSNLYNEHPDRQGSSVELEIFSPAAVQVVPDTATAYPWRDPRGYA